MKSKADIVFEKNAGVGTNILKGIWTGVKKLWGGTKKVTKKVKESPPGQWTSKQLKEYAPGAGVGLGVYGAHVYTNEQRRKAAEELGKAQTSANLTDNTLYDTYSTTAFQDSLRSDDQTKYLNTIKDPKKREITSHGINNYNQTRWYMSDPLLHKTYPKHKDYRKGLYDSGKLDPWKTDPNIVNPEWNK